jgi:hypothetical protein
VFIQIIQGRCTKQDELRAMADQWVRDVAPNAVGWLGGTYGFTDDDMFVGVVRFDSKEAAAENSRRPEQGQWWGKMEPLFDGPVEFHDCEDVSLMMDGGSDTAGFVQIIRGRVRDMSKLKGMMGPQQVQMLHEMRPELLGGTLAIEPDGMFTETIAFTDENSARQAEKLEMPAEVASDMEMAMTDVTYMDLHHPWFATRA